MVSLRMLNLCSLYQLGASALLSVAALVLSAELALGALFGGMLMAANFSVMKILAKHLEGEANPRLGHLLLWPVKFVAGLGFLAVLVVGMGVDVAGLAIGMSSLFVGVGGGMLHTAIWPVKAPA